MGIFEIHLHDAEFSWSVNPGIGKERSLSLKTGSKSKSRFKSKLPSVKRSSGGETNPSAKSNLGSLAVLGLVVGAGMAFNRLRARQARTARTKAESGSKSPGRQLSLFRGK